MRKRHIGFLLTMALIAAQSFPVLAAGSITGGSTAANGFATSENPNTGSATSTSGNNHLGFAEGEVATAGLPDEVVGTINSINHGEDLSKATGKQELKDYAALTATKAIVQTDVTTQEVSKGVTVVNLYVTNLVEGLPDIQVLVYSNDTGRWEVVKPNWIDFAKKQLSFNINGSSTYTIVYKKTEA